jgi:nucleotide-binding universal stress UspA family protein
MKFLLAYDGSEDAGRALEPATELAHGDTSTVRVVQVVPLHAEAGIAGASIQGTGKRKGGPRWQL